jgi:putative Holliday junction resolvase
LLQSRKNLSSIRLGRRIGIDFGVARIGVAVSSVDGIICSPLDTVQNDDSAVDRVLAIIREQDPLEVYVGLPLNLLGERTTSTELAISFAKALFDARVSTVRMVDERLSTRAAQSQLHASGKNTKQSKGVIDAAAATLILESALSYEKATGKLPGHDFMEFYE